MFDDMKADKFRENEGTRFLGLILGNEETQIPCKEGTSTRMVQILNL
jgi:hypothetical protein